MIDGSGIALQDRQRIRGRERETGGERGERETGGEEEARLGETELGGKIEMSNYQMTAVDSGISMGMLGKFSLLAPKQSTAVCMRVSVCACLCMRARMQRSPVDRMQTHTQLFSKIPKISPHCCTELSANPLLPHAQHTLQSTHANAST